MRCLAGGGWTRWRAWSSLAWPSERVARRGRAASCASAERGAALTYTCRMGRMGVLAFVALVISVCAVRLPGEHAVMPGMAAPEVMFNSVANAQSWSAIAEPESPPECCQIQQVLLSG